MSSGLRNGDERSNSSRLRGSRSYAEITTTGMLAMGALFLCIARSSKPSRYGNMISRIMRSGLGGT